MLRSLLLACFGLLTTQACLAENFSIYALGDTPYAMTTNMAIDLDSITHVGNLITYRVRSYNRFGDRVAVFTEVADCAGRRHGQRQSNESISSVSLYSVYPNTNAGTEVDIACGVRPPLNLAPEAQLSYQQGPSMSNGTFLGQNPPPAPVAPAYAMAPPALKPGGINTIQAVTNRTSANSEAEVSELYYQVQLAASLKDYPRTISLGKQLIPLPKNPGSFLPSQGAMNLLYIAYAYQGLQQYTEAESFCRQAIAALSVPEAQDPYLLGFAHKQLSEVQLLEQQPEDARDSALQATIIIEQVRGISQTLMIGPLAALGNAYLADGKTADAKLAIERGLRIIDATHSNSGVDTENLYKAAASLYRKTDRTADANLMEQRAGKVQKVFAVAGYMVPGSCHMQYPPDALSSGQEGSALVQLAVDSTGQVQSAVVMEGSGSVSLDKATINGYASCQFKPQIENGIPVRSTYSYFKYWNTKKVSQIAMTAKDCPAQRMFTVAGLQARETALSLRIALDADGKPTNFVVQNSTGDKEQDANAIAYARSCRYHASTFNGENVPNNAYLRLVPVGGLK